VKREYINYQPPRDLYCTITSRYTWVQKTFICQQLSSSK